MDDKPMEGKSMGEKLTEAIVNMKEEEYLNFAKDMDIILPDL